MDNKEILDILKQIQASISGLNQKVDDNNASLNKKIDDNYVSLNQKIDANYASLNQKIDDVYTGLSARIKKNYSLILSLQKDVKDLRTDIDIVYDLEKDSRKKLKQLI